MNLYAADGTLYVWAALDANRRFLVQSGTAYYARVADYDAEFRTVRVWGENRCYSIFFGITSELEALAKICDVLLDAKKSYLELNPMDILMAFRAE